MTTQHVDVLVVGAGLSGICAGYYLQERCPGRSYAILEGRDALGGTWDLFRYPGIRSDSDMFTFGYSFRPWTDPVVIAEGGDILSYLEDTARRYGVDEKIHYGHRISRASWSSEARRWTVEIEGREAWTCQYLLLCAGYFNYEQGHAPDFPGQEDFGGDIIHPQHWPEGRDCAGERVVIIGSGATAVTLLPSLAETAEHVVMLQRSPSYLISRPAYDRVAAALFRFLPRKLAWRLARWKNLLLSTLLYVQSKRKPDKVKAFLIARIRELVGSDFDVKTHFTPSYKPWDQRICLVPDDDLFEALKAGSASIVTDHIERFTETGIRLESGEHIEADTIVTATGLDTLQVGGVELVVDGEPVHFPDHWSYKGIAYSDVPNLAAVMGYFNASWTLRAELVCEYVCRLLNHMSEVGARVCTPKLRDSDASMKARPWITGFSSGYIQRQVHTLPKQGDREPWLNLQNYLRDRRRFRKAPIDDGVMRFT